MKSIRRYYATISPRLLGLAWSFQREFSRVIGLALSAPIVLPLLGLLSLARHRLRLRIVALDSTRIGHFVPGAAGWKAYLEAHPPTPATPTVFWWASRTSNAQWDAMSRRSLVRVPLANYVLEWNRLCPRLRALETCDEVGDPARNGLLTVLNGRLPFADDEKAGAEEALKLIGWRLGQPWVCIHVRDNAFLQGSTHPIHPAVGWSYHDYRDGNIESYQLAIELLLDRGFWVFRMGKKVSRPLNISHARFVDYPYWTERSDLLDIWLFAHCAGCVTTGSGPDIVSVVWNRPVLMVNLLPLSSMWMGVEVITVSKNLLWRESGRPLSLRDHVRNSFSSVRSYEDAGIAYEEQSPEMIRDLVSEFLPRLAGDPPMPESALQSRFWEVFSAEMLATHGITVKRSEAQIERVGEAWLRAQPPEFWE